MAEMNGENSEGRFWPYMDCIINGTMEEEGVGNERGKHGLEYVEDG